jgi:rubrerythrin
MTARPDALAAILTHYRIAAERSDLPRKPPLPPLERCQKCGNEHRALVCPLCKTESRSFAAIKARTERRK